MQRGQSFREPRPGKADRVRTDPNCPQSDRIEDCSIAAVIVHLAALSLGLGGCWIQIRNRMHSAEKTSEDYVREILGIAHPLRVLAIVAVGVPARVSAGHPFEKLDHGKVIG